MSVTIATVEKMKEEFEKGISPKEVAKKYKLNPWRVSSLARLLGYAFITSKRNPYDWSYIKGKTRPTILFTAKSIGLDDMTQYRVDDVDAKNKKITLSYM